MQGLYPGQYIALIGRKLVGHSSDKEELRRAMERDHSGELVVIVEPRWENLPAPKSRYRAIDLGDGTFRLMVR